MVLGTCSHKYCTVWCLVLVLLYSMWCLVLVILYIMVLGTCNTVHYGAWHLYLEELYSMVLGTCSLIKYRTVWCLVLVLLYSMWCLVLVLLYSMLFGTCKYLEVLYCSVLHVFLHPLPEESLHAVHVILLEQRVGWLGEPQSILIR